MGDVCKRHNKPKEHAWKERQAGGGSLNRIGCIDCKAEARNAPPRPRPRSTRSSDVAFFRRRF